MSTGIKENTQSADVAPVQESYTESAVDYSALWNYSYGGTDIDGFYGMTVCRDGGFAVAGMTESLGIDSRDSWVIRTDSSGHVLWTTLLTGNATWDTGYAITECANGDFIIAGASNPASDASARVDRINANGEQIWTTLIGEPGLDVLYDIIETSAGTILAVGTTESFGAVNEDVLILHLAPNGGVLWYRHYGGAQQDYAKSVIECSDGNFAILGNTRSFGGGNVDFWLLKIDVNGNLLVDETYGGTGSDYSGEIVEYSGGGYLMVGTAASLGDPSGDLWAIMVDEMGIEIWNETYPGGGTDRAYSVTEATRGGFAIAGTADLFSGYDQVRVTRIENDGTEIWTDFYGGVLAESPEKIVEVYPEEFAVAGYTYSYGAGDWDAWLFLIPGMPRLIDPPDEQHFEYGSSPIVEIMVESSALIDTWWLGGTQTAFDIVQVGDSGHVYSTFSSAPIPVGFYEIRVHVNNSAGQETEHIFNIYIDDTTEPTWSDFTENYIMEFGDQFQYTPTAYDLSLLDEWFLTGSAYFTIDSGTGEITNVGTPPVGEYNLEIQVNDMYHNSLTDSLQISVQDTTAPEWDTAPEDQTIDYGTNFVYDLDASDLAGIASWSVDSTEFSIDSQGRVRNLIALAPGEHSITVHVSDVNGNVLSGSFTVLVGNPPTVTGTETTTDTGATLPSGSIIDSAIPFAVGVVATLAVVTVICLIGRRKPPSK